MFGSDLFAAAGFADIQSGSAILGSMIFAIVVVLIGIGIKIWKKYGKHQSSRFNNALMHALTFLTLVLALQVICDKSKRFASYF